MTPSPVDLDDGAVRGKRGTHAAVQIGPDAVEGILAHRHPHGRRTDLIGE
jgi:hypothetical protein